MQGEPSAISSGASGVRRWWPRMVVAVAAMLSLWPARAPWSALIGNSLGETDNHLWMFWVAVRRVLGDPRILANAPDGVPIPLMDPINLPPFLMLWPLGPELAWSGLVVANAVIAALGGWILAREVAGPDAGEEVGALGAVALVVAPYFGGVVDFGITEALPLGWFALHAALLMRHARLGRRRDALGAGVCLGAIALSGWYHALFGVILEAMLLPWLLWRHRRPWTALQALIGLVAGIPSLLAFLPVRGLWAARWHPPSLTPTPRWPDWAVLPRQGTDALNLLLPSTGVAAPSKSVYLGVVMLGLALYGLRRAPRRVGPMLLLALPFLLLALGHWPRVAGEALGFRGPAWFLVTWVRPLQGLTHWYRAVGAALPFLAAAAAAGASELLRRRGALTVLAAALLLDSLLFSQTGWPRAAHAVQPPSALLSLPEATSVGSGIIELPFDNGRVDFSDAPARLYNQWQVVHQHPVSENYEGRDAVLKGSRLIAAADGATGVRYTGPPQYGPNERWRAGPIPTEPTVVAAEIAKLRGWGYRWVVLHRDRAVSPDRAEQTLDSALGEGRRDGGCVIWDLESAAR